MSHVREFPLEVIQEIKSYVYRLIDPRNGETFYIGKGKGNRVFKHMKGVLASSETDEVQDKLQTIWEIHNAGLGVIHVIHRHGMNDEVAFQVEAALIDAYPQVHNIQGGTGSNEYGPMNALEIINKYAAEEATFQHKILMITVNKSVTKKGIYDATRFAWKLGLKKLKKIEYVAAVVQGIIIEVFKPLEWKPATNENFPEFHVDRHGRTGFVGTIAEQNIRELYVQKRVPSDYRKRGAANPIKYTF